MSRATTKQQLMQSSKVNFNKLFLLINLLSKEEQESSFSFEDRDKNVRDVLVHLYEWHLLLLDWIHKNQSGSASSFLPQPYNWKTYPQMNVEFWKKHQSTSLAQSVDLVQKSHRDVMELIDTFTDEEFFTKKHFPWTGTTSLGSYCVSATSSHYDWAIKKLKRHRKTNSVAT
ncbi:MAG: ClbS/DfsB family four-helix bundle protein [Paludibacteraceae bacterium]